MARAQVDVDAGQQAVWRALTDPAQIAQWMMGAQVTTDWRVGGPITWTGELGGTHYEDRGEVLEVDEPNRLSVTHYSPLMGQDDRPESYHTVTYELSRADDGATTVVLTQDGNDSAEQAEQFSRNWQGMLQGLKGVVEA